MYGQWKSYGMHTYQSVVMYQSGPVYTNLCNVIETMCFIKPRQQVFNIFLNLHKVMKLLTICHESC
jgi:hypothetical protein